MTHSKSCNKLSLLQEERRMPNKDQIKYQSDLANISAQSLDGGFFEGWPNPPKPEVHLKHMQQSAYVVLAVDSQTQKVVGFISAVSDKLLSAYVPLLEVLPEYRNLGIGKELVRQMFEQLSHLYMVDLSCDDDLVSFYKKFGMVERKAMLLRNFARQSGA
jgi:ribosomal protein S18 acetylase RimI-like enzyme